jgi:hypothetical protein
LTLEVGDLNLTGCALLYLPLRYLFFDAETLGREEVGLLVYDDIHLGTSYNGPLAGTCLAADAAGPVSCKFGRFPQVLAGVVLVQLVVVVAAVVEAALSMLVMAVPLMAVLVMSMAAAVVHSCRNIILIGT